MQIFRLPLVLLLLAMAAFLHGEGRPNVLLKSCALTGVVLLVLACAAMFSFLLTAVFLLVAETKSLSTSLSKLGQQPSE